jgi:4-hydroxybenzoate polyprenyltransferase
MADDPGTAGAVQSVWDRVLATDRFIRLHQLFFSSLCVLLGAASVRRELTIGELSALLGVMLCFHIYTYVVNDVIDLPIDRTQPQRQHDPLVRGTIRPWQALLFALAQPALTIPLTMWLGATWRAHVTLAGGFVLMGAYNLWGKRCPFPPLMDAVQGLAWASLAVYAALAFGTELTTLTWVVASWLAVFTLFFNGIHGPLRDFTNDFARGARTTAIFLGARPAHGSTEIYFPFAVGAYASVVLALLIGISTAVMIRNDFGYGPFAWTITTVSVGALNLIVLLLHPKVVRPARGKDLAWRLQLYVVALSLPVAFVAYASAKVSIVLLLLNALALVLFGCTPAVLRWTWLTTRSVRVVDEKRLSVGVPRAS